MAGAPCMADGSAESTEAAASTAVAASMGRTASTEVEASMEVVASGARAGIPAHRKDVSSASALSRPEES